MWTEILQLFKKDSLCEEAFDGVVRVAAAISVAALDNKACQPA